MGRRLSLISIILITILQGCNTPVKNYDFVRIDANRYDTRDSVHLCLDVLDTTTKYSLYFTSRTRKDFDSPHILANMYITSPSGAKSSHYIEIPADMMMSQNIVKRSAQNGICDITWRWSENLVIKEAGEWRVSLHILNRGLQESYIIKGIQEIGINIEPNERKR